MKSYSGKVTQSEGTPESKRKDLPPFKNGVLTAHMVQIDLDNNVNNFSKNAKASADEVAKTVAQDFRATYDDGKFRASGNAVRYENSLVQVVKDDNGQWKARKIK